MAFKDLGAVTAYAYAVQGGYTGTEAQFRALLGNVAIDLSEIENLSVTVTTLPEGSQATASYSNGVLSLGLPRGSKGDTGNTGAKGDTGNGISSIELTSTVGYVKTYTITFTDGTTTTFEVKDGEVTEESLEETLEDYARVDGYYDEMTAGSAEQLLSSQFVEDSVPYKFRTSGGSKDIGNREYDEIVGGSIVWNQLRVNGNFASANGWSAIFGSVSANNNILTYTLAQVGAYYQNVVVGNAIDFIANHKYLAVATIRGKASPIYLVCYSSSASSYVLDVATAGNTVGGNWSTVGTVFNAGLTAKADTRIGFGNSDKAVGDTFEIKDFMIFDITQMFGSTVADYIYSLETAEAGKGVAFFKSLFPNDYYPYNAGELLSIEGLQSHDTVEFNQWDEEWKVVGDHISSKNYIPVLPNTAYYWNAPVQPSNGFAYYDENKNKIGGTVYSFSGTGNIFTTPSNCHFVAFSLSSSYGTTYKNDICINLSCSGWRNGEYEPYKKHSYALDSSLTLRGIPKLNAQNELYFDGDTYESDGTVTRRYGVVDLGSLTWDRWSQSGFYLLSTTINGIKYWQYNTPQSEINVNEFGYAYKGTSGWAYMSDKTFGFNGSSFRIRDDSYTSAEAFKTAMNGVYLIYELATPTEETAEPYTSPQAVDDFGTEEYISGNVVPVGHNTQYPANLRDKLQHLPNLADNDGYYMISQQNKQMSLELFRIPKAPTTDGTYTLKAHVSGGTPTYVWESEETE